MILRIPVDHPDFQPLLDGAAVSREIVVADTTENRRWVQSCARLQKTAETDRGYTVDILNGAPDALDVAPEAALASYARNTLAAGHRCFKALGELEQTRARYWWSEDGLTCASRAMIRRAVERGAAPHPLEVCPTVAHDPTTAPAWSEVDPGWSSLRADGPPAGMDWLMARCQEIVTAYPHSDPEIQAAYSADRQPPTTLLPVMSSRPVGTTTWPSSPYSPLEQPSTRGTAPQQAQKPTDVSTRSWDMCGHGRQVGKAAARTTFRSAAAMILPIGPSHDSSPAENSDESVRRASAHRCARRRPRADRPRWHRAT